MSSSEENIRQAQAFSESDVNDFFIAAAAMNGANGLASVEQQVPGMLANLFSMLPIIGEVISAKSLATGTTFGYSWWVVSFQFFAIAYGAFVTVVKPKLRPTAVGLFSVLTVITFTYTDCVCSAPLGAYAWSHNPSGTPATVTGTHATKPKNGIFVLFAGLIIVDVANVLFAMAVALDDADDAATPAVAKAEAEAPAVELATEA